MFYSLQFVLFVLNLFQYFYCFLCYYKWKCFLNFIFGLFITSYIEIQFIQCTGLTSCNSCINSDYLCVCSLGFSTCRISFAGRHSLLLFQYGCHYLFVCVVCLVAVSGASCVLLNRSDKSQHACLRGKHFSLSLLSVMLAVSFIKFLLLD